MNVAFTCVLVLLSVSGCARDELYRQSYRAVRYRQAWQERRHSDAKAATVSAAGVLRKAGYPLVPELLSEVERVIDDLTTLCPHFTTAVIVRSLARKYTVPWSQVEAAARHANVRPEVYGLRMLLMVHDGMLEDVKVTYCGEREW